MRKRLFNDDFIDKLNSNRAKDLISPLFLSQNENKDVNFNFEQFDDDLSQDFDFDNEFYTQVILFIEKKIETQISFSQNIYKSRISIL